MARAALLAVAFLAATVAAVNTPTQIRLAFTPTGTTVSWTTPAALPVAPVVIYGRAADSLAYTATGTSHTYGTSYFHDVVLTPLALGTTYFYQCISADTNSTVMSFRSRQGAGDATPFTVLVVGDMGLSNSADTMARMRDHVAANDTDFVLHIGDLSYADDFYLRGDTYENSWDKWQDQMQPVTSVLNYMTLPGNHEVTCTEVTPFLCPEGQKNFTAYRNRFRMPWRETGGQENMWYSFDYGLMHFIQISTESDFTGAPEGPGTYLGGGPFGDQLGWLAADLQAAAANRANVPWIIVSGHRPLYSSGGSCDACRTVFEPLFLKFDVDIVLAGHVHWYERLYSLANGGVVSQSYVDPTAPVYFVNGAAGNVEGHSTGSQQAFSAMVDESHYGYSTMRVHNATHVDWAFFAASDNSLVDSITVVKHKH